MGYLVINNEHMFRGEKIAARTIEELLSSLGMENDDVHSLHCHKMKKIREISGLNNLIKLTCEKCDSLTRIYDCPKLDLIGIQSCAVVRTIDEVPQLKT